MKRPSKVGWKLGAAIGLAAVAVLWTAGCLTMVGVAAMDVASKTENRARKRAIVGCREAGPVGHVVGTQLPKPGVPTEVFLRECTTEGEKLTRVPLDAATFETLGQSDGFYWSRDAQRLVVQHVPLVQLDQPVDDPPGIDFAPLLRDLALPERYFIGEFETTFLIAGGTVLYRDRGVLRSSEDHPYGWLHGVDVESFFPMGVRYAKDASTVWYRDQRIEGADPVSFEVLGPHFARDRRSAFYAAARIPGADLATFRATSNLTAEDRKTSYRIELSERGWTLYCGDAVCDERERARTLPGQRVEWTEYDRFVFR